MKLSEYKNEEIKGDKPKQNNKSQTIEQLYDTYKSMNQSELLNTLLTEVEKQKQEGTFDYQKIQSNLSQVFPFLNEEQKTNLLTILQKIK